MRYSTSNLPILKRAHDALVREWEEVKREFYARKFDPSQPRDDHGRWTDTGGGQRTAEPAATEATGTRAETFPNETGSGATSSVANRAITLAARGSVEKCEAQYEADSKLCRIVKTPLCWEQAMKRRAACVSGYDLPPLNFRGSSHDYC
jgi:hypothetical protein